ncbi:serine hydrolase-domain-containing protein [Xylariomycetidae sp. FL0641]|nr:serine hydrolase-domain-containing protein [Xylariomycetidae sp. FL0641]
MQTAAVRYHLGGDHSYEFIDGAVPADMAPGIESFHMSDEQCLQYVDMQSSEGGLRALRDLETLVDEEGPFDGVMGFSQGAALAASLIVHKMRKASRTERQRQRPVFRFAVFFCGGIPYDASTQPLRPLSFEADGPLIDIPTAHIWGANDQLYPSFGVVLSSLCRPDRKTDFIHPGGHEVPGPKDLDAVLMSTRAINRAIELAKDSP